MKRRLNLVSVYIVCFKGGIVRVEQVVFRIGVTGVQYIEVHSIDRGLMVVEPCVDVHECLCFAVRRESKECVDTQLQMFFGEEGWDQSRFQGSEVVFCHVKEDIDGMGQIRAGDRLSALVQESEAVPTE